MKQKQVALIVTSILLIILIQACATKSDNIKRTYTPTYHSPSISDYPAIGDIKTVEVGESLVLKEKQTSIPAIDIEQVIEHSVENLGKTYIATILPGRYVERGKDGFGKYYQAKEGKMLENGRPLKTQSGIYVSDSDAKKTEFYFLAANYIPLSYPRDNIPFANSLDVTRDELSFKKELVYTGISQNAISILYREFKNDMARPAFSQDLKYDLSESKIVGYRGARFEIIKATNQGLNNHLLK